MTVRVAGQRLSADVSIEQLTTSAGPTVKLALANVNLALGDGKQDLLTLTGGSGFWLIRSGGVAGRVQGTVALQNVPGVTLQGTLGLEVNTTNADVNETFTLNGFETKLEIAASRKFAVSGTGVTLALAGVSLSGDFVFTKDANKTRLDIVERRDRDQLRHHAPDRGDDRHRLPRARHLAGQDDRRRDRLDHRRDHRRHPERRLRRRLQGRLRHHSRHADVRRRLHRDRHADDRGPDAQRHVDHARARTRRASTSPSPAWP